MNTLKVKIAVKKDAKREGIFKDRNTGGRASKIGETLSYINSGTEGNYSNFKEKPRERVKYKLNENCFYEIVGKYH